MPMRWPDQKRRERVARLLREGRSIPAIARRMRVSRQAVSSMLGRIGQAGQPVEACVPIRCRSCRRVIVTGSDQRWRSGPAWCLACLAKRPHAPFGHRVRAFRLARNLMLLELGLPAEARADFVAALHLDPQLERAHGGIREAKRLLAAGE